MTELTPLVERVNAAKMEVKAVAKNGKNKFHGYDFATVDDMYEHLRPITGRHNLDVRLDIESLELKAVESGNNKSTWGHYVVLVGFVGEEPVRRFISVQVTGPQACGIVTSYVEKYFLRERLMVATGDVEADMMEKGDAPPPVQTPARTQEAPAPAQAPAGQSYNVDVNADKGTITVKPMAIISDLSEEELTVLARAIFRAIRAAMTTMDADKRTLFLQAEDVVAHMKLIPEDGRKALHAFANG